MASYEQLIATIYRAKPAHWPQRIPHIENYFRISDEERADELLDIEAAYRLLFQGALRERFTQDVRRLKSSLRDRDFDASQAVLDALQFTQSMVATALWKYGLGVGEELEAFARDYDRLDTEQDRQRLYREVVPNMR